MRAPGSSKSNFGAVGCIALALYAFLYLPLVVVVAYSFNANRLGTEWSGVTLDWYVAALQSSQTRAALENTLVLACCSTAISVLIGTLLGYGLERHQFRGKRLLTKALLLPMAVPDIVMAVSLLLFFALVRQFTGLFQLGMSAMIAAHVTFQLPFVALVIRARIRGLDQSIFEAAADLGATAWQTFWHITVPLLRPGIVSAALLAFTLSLDDFVVSFFTSGPGSTTLPIYIYSSVKRGVTAEIHAVSTLIMAAAVLGTIALVRFQNTREKR